MLVSSSNSPEWNNDDKWPSQVRRQESHNVDALQLKLTMLLTKRHKLVSSKSRKKCLLLFQTWVLST